MPAQIRPQDATLSPAPDDNNDSPQPDDCDLSVQPDDDNDDSDGSVSSSSGEKDEFIVVKLAEVRKEVQCPICLGIIRKTRTVMECLHRFCRECIDKSMRLGNNECPACRTHCASRRSLRDDPNYDALIAVLYPDIDKYEAEEFAFHEEEKARNKQIQASIAQTLRRQSEALGRKRTNARATAAAFVRRSQSNYHNLRGRRNQRASELQGSDNDDDNGNDGGKDSSSTDEPSTEAKPKRYRRWGGARFSQSSLAASSAEGGPDENELEVTRELVGAAGLIGSSEMLAWGRGGIRSNTRHGSMSGGNCKSARNTRLTKLMDHLKSLQENEDEMDIHLRLVSMDEQAIPNLEKPYLCCSSTMSVKNLCQIIAVEAAVPADEIEILLAKEVHAESNPLTSAPVTIDPFKDELHILEEHETVGGLQDMCHFSQHGLLLAYRKRLTAPVGSDRQHPDNLLTSVVSDQML